MEMVKYCSKCYDIPKGWMDNLNLVIGRCDQCGKHGFCHQEERKEEPEWAL